MGYSKSSKREGASKGRREPLLAQAAAAVKEQRERERERERVSENGEEESWQEAS